MIRAHNYSYQHATRPRPAFVRLSFELERGRRILLTGDSGAGKSTLLLALAGLLSDEEEGTATGTLEVEGTVGVVLQDPDSQVISSRVGDDVAFGCENLNILRSEIWLRVEKALAMVDLELPLDYPTRLLSGGQKQRLALAGVLAMGADIILLDEPTANLDPAGRAAIVRAVDQAARATAATVIVAEHRGHHWVDVVDEIWQLDSEGIRGVDKLPDPPILPPARTPSTDIAVEARSLRTRVGAPHSCVLPAGTSTIITGRNGVGKSTFALTLAGLLEPVAGSVEYADYVSRGLKGGAWQWRSSDLARRIGYVSQDPEHQFVARTVADEMLVGGADEAHAARLMERLRLDHLAEANPFTLSGGEKRRLSVAMTLVNAPEVVILDEPTFGQDDTTFIEMVGLVRELADRGVAVASITHDEVYMRALGDHEVIIA